MPLAFYVSNDTLSHIKKTAKFKIQEEKRKFHDHLSKNGLRLTTGREIVFQEVMNAHGHFAAEELVKQCHQNHRDISRATVYRNLHDLLEAGVIRETAFSEKHTHYEHIYDEEPHHHARCIRCGLMIEFPDLREDKIYHPVLAQHHFKVLGHEMHFYGICHQCQRREDQ